MSERTPQKEISVSIRAEGAGVSRGEIRDHEIDAHDLIDEEERGFAFFFETREVKVFVLGSCGLRVDVKKRARRRETSGVR